MMKYKKVCSSCGSDDLNFDAFVKWDSDKQDFYIENIYDNVYCCTCGGETIDVDIEIIELSSNIKIL